MRWRAEPGCTRFFDSAAFSIFPLGDSARRTLRKTDLNKAMHQSRESSRFRSLKASVFRFVRDFFALGAELPRERTGSPLYVGMQTAKAHAETLRRGGKRTACAMIAIPHSETPICFVPKWIEVVVRFRVVHPRDRFGETIYWFERKTTSCNRLVFVLPTISLLRKPLAPPRTRWL